MIKSASRKVAIQKWKPALNLALSLISGFLDAVYPKFSL